MESKKKIAHKKQSKPTGWSAVLTVFVSSKFYCLFVDFKVKSMQKNSVKSCSTCSVHCGIGDKCETWAKERATGDSVEPMSVRESVQCTVQELQPELGSPLWTSSKQDSS
jgi:hypothetical protein